MSISPRPVRNELAPAAADTSYMGIDELGDRLDVSVRLILARATGRFFPSVPPDMSAACCTQEGQVVGTVNSSSDPLPVLNPWLGLLMGYLVIPGQRVSERTPVAWVALDGVGGSTQHS